LSNGSGHDDAKQPRNSLTCPIPDQTERSSVTTDLALSLFSRWLLDLIYSRLIYFESKHDCRSNKLYLFLWSDENFTCYELFTCLSRAGLTAEVMRTTRGIASRGACFIRSVMFFDICTNTVTQRSAHRTTTKKTLSLSLSSLVKIGTKPATIQSLETRSTREVKANVRERRYGLFPKVLVYWLTFAILLRCSVIRNSSSSRTSSACSVRFLVEINNPIQFEYIRVLWVVNDLIVDTGTLTITLLVPIAVKIARHLEAKTRPNQKKHRRLPPLKTKQKG
jgi:hypothetical protein